MKSHPFSRTGSGIPLLLLTTFLLLAASGPLMRRAPEGGVYALAARAAAAPQSAVYWHAGNFRYLDAEEHDLLSYVDDPDLYPNEGLYGGVSPNRTQRFNAP